MSSIMPLSLKAQAEVISKDYLSTDHIGKFNEILASETSYRPQEVLLMWNMYHVISPVNTRHIQILPGGATECVTHWIYAPFPMVFRW